MTHFTCPRREGFVKCEYHIGDCSRVLEKVEEGGNAELAVPHEANFPIEDEATIEQVHSCRERMSDWILAICGL